MIKDVGNVEVIVCQNHTEYRIEYKGKQFEFWHENLLTERDFNRECLAAGIELIAKKDWLHFINGALEKATIVAETEYKPNIMIAKKWCNFLLGDGIDEYGLSLIDGKDGYYYFTQQALTYRNCELKNDLLERILEKNNVKLVGEERKRISGKCFITWKLDPIKLKEFAEWKED